MKKLSIVVLISCMTTLFAAKKPISKYYFAQQTNGICLMVPVLNLEILETLQSNNYDLSKLPSYSRADWFGILNPFEVAWFTPFGRLNFVFPEAFPNRSDYLTLKDYIDNGALHGPVLPYFYTKNGKFPFGGFFKGADEALQLFSLPFMLVDLNGAENFKLKILFNLVDVTKQFDIGEFRPLLLLPALQTEEDKNNGILRIFNQYKKKYEQVQEKDYIVATNTYNDPVTNEEISFDTFNISQVKNQTENFTIDYFYHPLFKTYSYVGIYNFIGQAYRNDISEYVPYMQGIYKLILLTLGINHDNNILAVDGNATNIIDAYGERDVMIALQNICNADDNHPWNQKRFNKDMFLPYAIAEILKKNPYLTNQLKQTVDIGFHEWEQYKKLVSGTYYNKNNEQMTLESIAQFIPGEHQALAYMMLHNLRFLWYGSQDPKAFYAETLLKLPLVWTFDNFAKKAAQKKAIKNGVDKNASFLDTWILIRDALKKQYKRNSWMSFEGHGWVISFDPEIIKLERSKSKTFYNDKLNKLLGFAGIESFLSNELKMFYKIQQTEEEEKNKNDESSEDVSTSSGEKNVDIIDINKIE